MMTESGSTCTKKAAAADQARAKPKPTAEEAARAAEAELRTKARRSRLRTEMTTKDEQITGFGPVHDDPDVWTTTLLDAFGTPSSDFVGVEIGRLGEAQIGPGQSHPRESEMNAAIAAIDGIEPANEMQAQLAAQMVLTHGFATDLLGRAKRSGNVEQMEAFGGLANKLLRTYVAQIEALTRLKRGSEQQIVVKHVNVYEGGKAVVGNVAAAGQPAGQAPQSTRPALGQGPAPMDLDTEVVDLIARNGGRGG